MSNHRSRRNFLRTAPLAASLGLCLPEAFAATLAPEAGQGSAILPFQLFPAHELEQDAKTLEASAGNKNLFEAKESPLTVVMTTEKAKSAKEFEWHEGRDHVVQILEGSTVYELGGTPRNGHTPKTGEWLAPESTGATRQTLNKGDMLVIPRGVPHKRSTADSVTFYLISSSGVLKS